MLYCWYITSCAQAHLFYDLTVLESSAIKKRVVRDYIENVINTGDTQNISDFIAHDYREIYNGVTYDVGIKGAEEHVIGVHETYAKLKLQVDKQWCEGDYVITNYVMTGIHVGPWMDIKPTHEEVKVYGINIDKVVNGKISEHGGAANLLEPLLSIGGISINKD